MILVQLIIIHVYALSYDPIVKIGYPGNMYLYSIRVSNYNPLA